MSQNERDPMKHKIQNWLVEEGFQVRREDVPAAYFQLAVAHPLGINLVVLQPLDRSDQIIVAGAVNLNEAEQKKLADLPSPERQDLLWDLRLSLLTSGFDFNFQPPNAEVMQRIIINDSLWYDGISKHAFMKSLGKVSNGIILVMWKLGRRFGGPLPKEDSRYVG